MVRCVCVVLEQDALFAEVLWSCGVRKCECEHEYERGYEDMSVGGVGEEVGVLTLTKSGHCWHLCLMPTILLSHRSQNAACTGGKVGVEEVLLWKYEMNEFWRRGIGMVFSYSY